MPRLRSTFPWLTSILPWLRCILPWLGCILPEWDLYCQSGIYIAVATIYIAIAEMYIAMIEMYIAMVISIVPWLRCILQWLRCILPWLTSIYKMKIDMQWCQDQHEVKTWRFQDKIQTWIINPNGAIEIRIVTLPNAFGLTIQMKQSSIVWLVDCNLKQWITGIKTATHNQPQQSINKTMNHKIQTSQRKHKPKELLHKIMNQKNYTTHLWARRIEQQNKIMNQRDHKLIYWWRLELVVVIKIVRVISLVIKFLGVLF
jgi:hypothetical protein